MKTTFDSGLTAIVEPLYGSPVVAFQVWIHSGSFDERDHERGLAHLHEHMLFKGTPTRGVGEIASAIEACGGQINAWTSNDQTCYHIVLPAHEWRNGLSVLADAVCHPLFDATELEREIEVVVEEIKRAADSPGQVAFRRVFERVFAGHPYALPVLGTAESVRSMTPARMRAFYEQHYVAGNTTVVAVGDLDQDAVLQAIREVFADLPNQPAPSRPPADAHAVAASAEVLETAFSESRVLLSWPAPPLQHPDVPALDLLAIVLGQGDSSRLVRTVQREQQLVNDVGASAYTPERAGLFSVTLLTSRDRLDAARHAVLVQIRELLEGGVTRPELDKARNNVLADATYKLETVQGQAHSLGYFGVATGDPHWEKTYDQRVLQATCEDLVRVARTWLRPEHVQVLVMPGVEVDAKPESAEPQTDTGALLTETVKQLTLTPESSRPGRSRDVVDHIERIVLPSGDLLVVQQDRSVAMMGLRVAALGGLRAETTATNGASQLIAQLLTRGTQRRSSDEIAHEIETLAAGLGGFAGRNSVGMHATTLSTNRDAVLDLLFDTLFEASLPEYEVDQQRKVQLEDIRHQADAPARQALRAMGAALYGNHPYGQDILGTTETVTALRREDLLADARGRLAPGRLVWAAAGDVDADELAAAIVARTPANRPALAPPTPQPVEPLNEVVRVRLHAEKQQAHLAIGFLGTTMYRPERYALDVLSTILGGQGGRLFLELRDRQSLAYTVSAMHADGIDDGYFALYIGTSPDKAQTALDGLYAELDKVLQSPVTADELDRARRYLAGAHAIGLQRRSSRASTICLNELYGLGREAYRGHLDALLAVTSDDVLTAARRVLNRDKCVEVVLKPE